MRLVPNWRVVLRDAWSVRLIVAAFVLTAAEVMLPLMGDALPVPRFTFAALSALASAGAFVARLVAQSSISGGEK